jgi:lipoate-protein ligase A
VAELPLIRVRPGRVPIVVLGRGQRELWTESALTVRVRLRASGGGAVLVGPWLLRSTVVLPRTHAAAQHGPVGAARWYGDVHQRWLRAQGIVAAAVYEGPTVEHWACFAGRVRGEVVIGHRKIVGIAQAWRKETVLLSAGTLVSPSPWALLCATLRRAPDEVVSLAALTISVQDCLGHPIDSRDWANDLSGALRRALGQGAPSADGPACTVAPTPPPSHAARS